MTFKVIIPFSNHSVIEPHRFNRMTDEVWIWLMNRFDDYVEKVSKDWDFKYDDNQNIVFEFKDKEDAILFKLTWGGK